MCFASVMLAPLRGSVILGSSGTLKAKQGVGRAPPRLKENIMSISRLAAVMVATSFPIVCQQGSVTDIGPGCPGTLGVPQLQSSLPTVGQRLLLSASNIAGPMEFAIGVLPRNIDLSSAGAPGCVVLIDSVVGFLGVPSNGEASLVVPLPTSPSLVGVTLYSQAFVADQAANQLGAVVSNGLALTFGATSGSRPVVTGVSNPSPVGGSTVRLTGANFAVDAVANCSPGLFPKSVNADRTEMVAVVANSFGRYEIEIGEMAAHTGWGSAGSPFFSLPAMTAASDAFGVSGSLDSGTVSRTGVWLDVRPPTGPGLRSVPFEIDPNNPNRICINYSQVSLSGGEKVEVELHFDLTPTPSNGRDHCDFFSTVACASQSADRDTIALSIAFWITAHLGIQCPGFSVQSDLMNQRIYILAPTGFQFRGALHPRSHITVL